MNEAMQAVSDAGITLIWQVIGACLPPIILFILFIFGWEALKRLIRGR